jgi:hypothetical protein
MLQNTVQRGIRLVLISAIALVFLGAQVVAHAQDAACFGLQGDDCALLQAASKADMTSIKSFTLDYDINFKATGMPDGDAAVTVHGTGPFDANGADFSALSKQTTLTMPDTSKLTGILSKLIFGTTVDVDANTKGKDTKYHAELRILNNKLYINEATFTQGKWQVLDLASMAGMMQGLAAQGGALPGVATQAAPAAASADMMAQMQGLAKIDGLVTGSRGPDVTVGSDKIAAFVFTVDLQKLFNSPDILTMIKAAQDSQVAQGKTPKLTDDQVKAELAKVATATKDLKISFTRYVGISDKLPHGAGADITGNADFSGLKGDPLLGSSSASSSVPTGPLGLDIHLKFVISGIGAKANLAAPDGATPFNFGAPAPAAS